MAEIERAAVVGEDHRALDHVLHLAHVAGPAVVDQRVDRALAEAGDRLAVLLARPLHEPVHQQRDVVAPVAQGRHADREDVEAEIEVLAERAVAHRVAQVDVGGGDDAHVDLAHPRVADALDLALLQRAQELALGGEAQRADLVEEQGSAVRPLEPARARDGRAGEAALLHAEQLRFGELLGDRGAVDGDERAVRALREPVQVVGEDLLADPAFAEEQHGRLRSGRPSSPCGRRC